jgi:hypothetical protein
MKMGHTVVLESKKLLGIKNGDDGMSQRQGAYLKDLPKAKT